MGKKLNINEVKGLYKSKGYTLLEDKFISSRTRMKCIDEEGFKYLACENLIQNNRKPNKYDKSNPFTMENIQHMLDIESQGSVLKTRDYINNRMKLTITCECCGEEITKSWGQIVSRKNFKCNKCNKQFNSKKYDYNFIKEQFKSKGYTLLSKEYKGNSIPLLCLDSDGYKVKLSFSNLMCGNKKPNRFSEYYNKDNLIFNINHYFKLHNIDCQVLSMDENKIINSGIALTCQCECGNIFQTSWNSIYGGKVRCDYCSKTMSNLEFKVRCWLDEHNIEYEFQKRFKDCKDKFALPFDFYIPQFNCCIEVDGSQHFYPYKFSNECDEIYEFQIRQKHDNIKNNYCETHNIDLLRINYNEITRKNNNYKNILSNKFFED